MNLWKLYTQRPVFIALCVSMILGELHVPVWVIGTLLRSGGQVVTPDS